MLDRNVRQLQQTLLDEYRGDVQKAFDELCKRYCYLLFRLDEPPAQSTHQKAVKAVSVELDKELDR